MTVLRAARRAARLVLTTSAVFVLVSSSDARADEGRTEEPAPFGVRFGARSGFAIPAGTTFGGSGPLSDTVTGYLPVRADAGLRIFDHLYVGALAQLADLLPKACPAEVQCSGSDMRFGAMLAFHVRPRRLLDPWIGAGMGYEIMSVKRTSAANDLRLTARGIELLDLELGVDLRSTSRLRLGPLLSGSLGRYTSIELNGRETRDFESTLHGWAMAGLRGMYDL